MFPLQDGKIDVIANDLGDRTTPAVVAFSENEKVSLKDRSLVAALLLFICH